MEAVQAPSWYFMQSIRKILFLKKNFLVSSYHIMVLQNSEWLRLSDYQTLLKQDNNRWSTSTASTWTASIKLEFQMEACSPTTQPLIWTGEPIILIWHYRTYCKLPLHVWLGLPQLVQLLLHHLLAMERWCQSKNLRTLSFIKNLILFSFKVPSRPLSVIDFHGLNDKTIPYRSLSLFWNKNTSKAYVML